MIWITPDTIKQDSNDDWYAEEEFSLLDYEGYIVMEDTRPTIPLISESDVQDIYADPMTFNRFKIVVDTMIKLSSLSVTATVQDDESSNWSEYGI